MYGSEDAFKAEVLSCRLALEWTRMTGYRRVKVETDCINLVHALKSRHAFASQVGFLQQDCKEILNELPEFCISYVIRSSNRWLMHLQEQHPPHLIEVCGEVPHQIF